MSYYTGPHEPLDSDETGLEYVTPVVTPGREAPEGHRAAARGPATLGAVNSASHDVHGHDHVHLDRSVYEPEEPGLFDRLVDTIRGMFGARDRAG